MSAITFTQENGMQITNGGGYALDINGANLQPSLGILYGPYDSVDDAHDSILGFLTTHGIRTNAIAQRKIPKGFTVGIMSGDTIIEYCYCGTKPSTGYTSAYLKPKIWKAIDDALSDTSDNPIKTTITNYITQILEDNNVVKMNDENE